MCGTYKLNITLHKIEKFNYNKNYLQFKYLQ